MDAETSQVPDSEEEKEEDVEMKDGDEHPNRTEMNGEDEDDGDKGEEDVADDDEEEEDVEEDVDEEGEEEDDNDEGEEEEEDQQDDDADGDEDGEGEDDDDDEEDDDDEDEDEDGEKSDDNDGSGTKGKSVWKKKRQHRRSKVFDDAFYFEIPLDVTADLKVAINHTREKRIKSILRRFPSIQKERKAQADQIRGDGDDGEDAEMDQEEKSGDESNGDDKPSAASSSANSKKKKMKPEHVPQPDRFGSVLDYLEAKYVRGVMYDDEEEEGEDAEGGGGPDADEKSEGQGSVYSKDSFLDDTDLQRDVAEQVMATSTLTRLEMEEDGGEFFVNVGNLEVENDEYGDQYDPLLDKENITKKKKRKKAPATTPKSTASDSKSSKSSKKNKAKQEDSSEPPKKKKKKAPEATSSKKPSSTATSTPGSSKSKKSTATASAPASSKSKKSVKSLDSASTVKTGTVKDTSVKKKKPSKSPKNPEATKAMKAAKKKADALYRKIVGLVKKLPVDSFPKKKTNKKFSLTCPAGKGPGDEVMFTNPHNPKQRLKVKVPKDVKPGGTFRVTVPVKHEEADSGGNRDHNKLGREIQDLIDDYGRAYDDYCTARLVLYPTMNINKEKQAKFDKLATEFPTGLLTPVDPNYLKQVARRARQNKYKRQKTAEARQQQLEVAAKKEAEAKEEEEDESESEEEEEEEENIIDLPGKGVVFPTIDWQTKDFDLM